jgi:hypothetical protein
MVPCCSPSLLPLARSAASSLPSRLFPLPAPCAHSAACTLCCPACLRCCSHMRPRSAPPKCRQVSRSQPLCTLGLRLAASPPCSLCAFCCVHAQLPRVRACAAAPRAPLRASCHRPCAHVSAMPLLGWTSQSTYHTCRCSTTATPRPCHPLPRTQNYELSPVPPHGRR